MESGSPREFFNGDWAGTGHRFEHPQPVTDITETRPCPGAHVLHELSRKLLCLGGERDAGRLGLPGLTASVWLLSRRRSPPSKTGSYG